MQRWSIHSMHSNNFCLHSLRKKNLTKTNSFSCGNLLWLNSKVILKSVCIYSARQIFVKYTGCWSRLKDKGYGGRRGKEKSPTNTERWTEWTLRKSIHLPARDTFLLAETATFWGRASDAKQRGCSTFPIISKLGSAFAYMSESNGFNFSTSSKTKNRKFTRGCLSCTRFSLCF